MLFNTICISNTFPRCIEDHILCCCTVYLSVLSVGLSNLMNKGKLSMFLMLIETIFLHRDPSMARTSIDLIKRNIFQWTSDSKGPLILTHLFLVFHCSQKKWWASFSIIQCIIAATITVIICCWRGLFVSALCCFYYWLILYQFWSTQIICEISFVLRNLHMHISPLT